ncbi:MAG: hypothetical protein HUK21_12250, partial [Fibrobacteraceae bacterium]|nr:hypothetical protein [Fibrobacteraceae bacterium]
MMFGSARAQMDVCYFDLEIAEFFEHGSLSMIPDVLDLIAEGGPQMKQGLCNDLDKRKRLTSKVGKLYNKQYKDGRHDPFVYARYLSFSGAEVDGRILTTEDNALLNVVLEYLIAKYDSYYAYCKKNMLNGLDKRTGNLHEYVYENFIDLGSIVNLTMGAAKGPNAITSEVAYEFAYLWVREDNPFPQDAFYSFDYTWIVDGKVNFLKRYPHSRYETALNSMINEELAKELREFDKRDSKLGIMVGIGVGKTFLSSSFKDFDETFTATLPTGRIQIFKVIVQIQPDIMICDSASLTGFDFMLGYPFEGEEYALDLLGGIGFMQSTYDDIDTSEHIAYMGGMQVMRFFP